MVQHYALSSNALTCALRRGETRARGTQPAWGLHFRRRGIGRVKKGVATSGVTPVLTRTPVVGFLFQTVNDLYVVTEMINPSFLPHPLFVPPKGKAKDIVAADVPHGSRSQREPCHQRLAGGLPNSFKIHQRGVQWVQGVVIYMMLYNSLLYNTTPIHCTPLRLHPPVMNTHSWEVRVCPFVPCDLPPFVPSYPRAACVPNMFKVS